MFASRKATRRTRFAENIRATLVFPTSPCWHTAPKTARKHKLRFSAMSVQLLVKAELGLKYAETPTPISPFLQKPRDDSDEHMFSIWGTSTQHRYCYSCEGRYIERIGVLRQILCKFLSLHQFAHIFI